MGSRRTSASQAGGPPTAPTLLLSPGDYERVADLGKGVRAAALKQCLPIGLVFVIILGLAAPVLGIAVASKRILGFGVVDTLCVWLIFFISGITLKTEEAREAIGAWRAVLWALFSILGATPLVSPLAFRLPPPFPHEFAVGFAIFCAMPTTINTGVALTVQAKGSFALALVVTVLSSLLAVFTVPFFLSAVLGLTDVKIDPVALLSKLLILILVPLALGKGMRELSVSLRSFLAAHKQALSLFSNGALMLIPWMKISSSAALLKGAGAVSILLVLSLALAIHALFLVFNWGGCTLLRLPDEQFRAVVIMASQKTLPMAMAVLAAMPPELGEPGLIAIPCIVAHLAQIFVDAFIATRWASIPLHNDADAGARNQSTRLHDSVEMGRSHDPSDFEEMPGGLGRDGSMAPAEEPRGLSGPGRNAANGARQLSDFDSDGEGARAQARARPGKPAGGLLDSHTKRRSDQSDDDAPGGAHV